MHPGGKTLLNMPKYEKSLTRRGDRMTYILGANCIDGIVLVADRKVTYKENHSDVDFRQKLFGFPSNLYYPIVVGCAGSTVLSDQFEGDIKAIAGNYYGERIIVNNFISQLIFKIREYFQTTYKNKFKPEEFEIIIALQTQDEGAILKHIPGEAIPIDVKKQRYKVCGSASGMMRTRTIFEPLWHRELNMMQAGELGYFFIKYVERYHLDDLIGVERGAKPQIWYIPNKGHLSEAKETYLTDLENLTQQRLSKNEDNLKELFVK
jgi:hypothetical protein